MPYKNQDPATAGEAVAVALDELPDIVFGKVIRYGRLQDHDSADDGSSVASNGLLELL